MKTEDTFHWYIYICSCLCKGHYYYPFIHWCQFENLVFVMSSQTDVQYYLSSFFFLARPGRWKNHLSLAGPGMGLGRGPTHTYQLHIPDLKCQSHNINFGKDKVLSESPTCLKNTVYSEELIIVWNLRVLS